MSNELPAILQNPDPAVLYQQVYDSLKSAYWDTTDINSKDLIYGAQQAIGEIIRAIDKQELATNTLLYQQLLPKISAVNVALCKIRNEINSITKNLATAGTVLAAINKILSFFPV